MINKEHRNMATSGIARVSTTYASWRDWSIRRSVKDGYKVSGWVYKAVNLIAKNVSTVPWVVRNSVGEIVPNHPISNLLANPNKTFSRQDFFELLATWQQLSGEAYAKQVFIDDFPVELWPISPDRIAPKESLTQTALIDSYEVLTDTGKLVTSDEFTPENVISFRFLDPANPIHGIGPLQVAAKAVDIDTEQLCWNKSAMQNRGVLDGVFTFAERLEENVFSVYKQKIKELFSGKREIGVIGSNAKYQQLSLSPVEMDFLNSRKFNREEIFIIFGVPPQLAGVQEATTYNNFNTARIVFWETTLIPILDDLKSTFNMAFSEHLDTGDYVDYDISAVPALKRDLKEKAEIAKIYSDMGVPVEQVNEMFSLGVPEYPGWDEPYKKTISTTQGERASGLMLKKLETRDVNDVIAKKESLAVKETNSFTKALEKQQAAVFKALENSTDTVGAVAESSDAMRDELQKFYKNTAVTFAGSVLVDERGFDVDFEKRAIDPLIEDDINNFLETETIILSELSQINKTTIEAILDAVIDGEAEGKTINAIQQSILDSGTFSSERALRIARTVSGTAQSIGQMAGAKSAGATRKEWIDSGFEVRNEHQERNGEIVGIDDNFSSKFGGSTPRYPLDQNASASDRINCRCSMVFHI